MNRPPKSLSSKEKRIIAEARRRAERVEHLDWERLLFPKQRAFIVDPSRLKAACCGRRAGKSHGVALALLKAGFENPGTYPIYVNMNRASAKGIIWPALRTIDRDLALGLRFDNTHGHIHLPNDSAIMIYGAGSKREMDKMRGLSPPAICLDEAQNMGQDMIYLLTQVLLPATFDHKAPIMITGTPSNSRHNPFYRICHGQKLDKKLGNFGWSLHHWTMHDNPYIPDVDEQLAMVRDDLNWHENTPAYLREYKGIWVFDDDRRIFNQTEDMIVDRWPQELATDWRFVLGVDLGTSDPCAFTVIAYSRMLGAAWVLESYRMPGLDTDDAGAEIMRIYNRYPPFSHTVVDAGGQGAAFVKRWKKSHPDIPARPVQKGADSVEMGISLMNADIRRRKLFFVERNCMDLLHELDTLQWDERAMEIGKRAVKAGMSDHSMDSCRYALTKVYLHDTGGFVVDDSPRSREDRLAEMAAAIKAEELKQNPPTAQERFWSALGLKRR